MDADFWIKAWSEGRTNFHQGNYHEKLVEYFPSLNPHPGQKVLVPLCGKTKDLLWLHDLKLHVHGVELSEQAVKSFFAENKLGSHHITHAENFTHYTCENILIRCGDFFKLGETEAYDFIYDRAALVALPPAMRKNYAQVIKRALKKSGKYLLIVYEYDSSKMDGPPFSVSPDEIQTLYGDHFSLKQLESIKPIQEGSRLLAVESLRQTVYILEKNSLAC